MNDHQRLDNYIAARRIAGTHDNDVPPTEPNASPSPIKVKHVDGCALDCGGVFNCPQCGKLCGWCFGGAPDTRCNDCAEGEVAS